MVLKYTRFFTVIACCLIAVALISISTINTPANKTYSWFNILVSSLFAPTRNPPGDTNSSTDYIYKTYAALGDSVAAGAGLRPLSEEKPIDVQCQRSSQSFPVLLSRRLHSKLEFAACGWATTSHLIRNQKLTTLSNNPQLTTAFSAGRPDVVTITLGANDTSWIPVISDCFTSTCNTPHNTTVFDDALSDFKMKLYYDVYTIVKKSHGKAPKIILTGYYSMGTPSCLTSYASGKITPQEAIWMEAQTTKLNSAIKSIASEFPSASYVSLNTQDHGLCASGTNRWIQNPGDPVAFHLTASGEQAMANIIYVALKSTHQHYQT